MKESSPMRIGILTRILRLRTFLYFNQQPDLKYNFCLAATAEEEISGVNCQESTKEELLESLRITLKEALDFNRYEAIEAAGDVYEEELIAL